MDEAGLIRDAQRGDVHAYNRLVLAFQDQAYGVAYRIMGDPAAAADITQDAMIAAYNALNSFKGGNYKAWLLRIVTNRCYDELRRRKRRPQSSLDAITDENESFSALEADQPSPESIEATNELLRAIQSCLEGLPDEQRIAAVLCDVEGYDYNEIARITRASLGTVKSRMSRARAKLRDCLQGFGELLPAQYRL